MNEAFGEWVTHEWMSKKVFPSFLLPPNIVSRLPSPILSLSFFPFFFLFLSLCSLLVSNFFQTQKKGLKVINVKMIPDFVTDTHSVLCSLGLSLSFFLFLSFFLSLSLNYFGPSFRPLLSPSVLWKEPLSLPSTGRTEGREIIVDLKRWQTSQGSWCPFSSFFGPNVSLSLSLSLCYSLMSLRWQKGFSLSFSLYWKVFKWIKEQVRCFRTIFRHLWNGKTKRANLHRQREGERRQKGRSTSFDKTFRQELKNLKPDVKCEWRGGRRMKKVWGAFFQSSVVSGVNWAIKTFLTHSGNSLEWDFCFTDLTDLKVREREREGGREVQVDMNKKLNHDEHHFIWYYLIRAFLWPEIQTKNLCKLVGMRFCPYQ